MSKEGKKGGFFSQVKYEMSQVNFPGGKELRQNTLAIIVVVILSAIFFYFSDLIIQYVLNLF